MRKKINKSNLWNNLFSCEKLSLIRDMTAPALIKPEDVPLSNCKKIYFSTPVFPIVSPSITFFRQFNHLNTMRFDLEIKRFWA